MKKQSIYVIVLLICLGCQTKNDLPQTQTLHNNWQFKNATDASWLPATVPGNVHSDLLDNKRIEHPFIGANELKLEWVSLANWDYETHFNVADSVLNKKHAELIFEGLDTYASVFLNDSLVLKTNNAFRAFQVDVKPLLKAENKLQIRFNNTQQYEKKEASKLAYQLPEGNRIFTRKAQFQYGWDWGPKLNTSGIWKPIKLKTWNNVAIKQVFVNQDQLLDDLANLSAEIELDSKGQDKLSVSVFVNDSLVKTQRVLSEEKIIQVPFQINDPKLWWPHNLGTPHLYNIKIEIKKGSQVLDVFQLKKGLRTIELVTEKDKDGESFYFKVNNVPVYAKGANYIPQNSMQNLVTNSHYETLLNAAVEANMNMLRVWGGGIYENDIFYDLCDEKGILVWQDFMFACAMYPGDDAFLDNVKQEADFQVKRLRNHTSLALWCGNNENSEGWKRWGWQANRSEDEKQEIWSHYLKVFDTILPEIVKKNSITSYWETSPKYGRGNPKYKLEGDAHDWWIWHDAFPFEHLEDQVPRFMSEFGFQSFPSYEAIRYINKNDSLSITSEGFQTHQKHARGFQLINEYMKRDFPVPTSVEDYVYVSQLLQAHGITKGIEAQRRAKPYNMGTLYWQLNDCWPVVSWSSIDYFGNWKALHYKVKRSFENLLISSKVENDTLKTFLVNDALQEEKGLLKIEIINFSGRVIFENSLDISVSPNSSKIYSELNLKPLKLNASEVVVVTSFNENSVCTYLERPKNLKLKAKAIQKKITPTATGFAIELTSDVLQKEVFLYSEIKGHFTNNFFDLLPNQTQTIHFKTSSKTLNDLKIKTLNRVLTSH